MVFFEQIIPYAIAFTMPLLITALGGLFSERSGVVNIGLEGLMIVGSFMCAFVASSLEPALGGAAIWVGMLAAVLAGAVFSLLHAFASINLNANQVISGTAINMIAAAVCIFIARKITGAGNIRANALPRGDVPILSQIPVLKVLFTNSYASTWVILALLVIGAIVLYKTKFGLRLRACGENPHAADAAGIRVQGIRYAGVVISGALSGLGGALIIATRSGEFNGNVQGSGFLALAALIFGQWKPLGILGATFFFGFALTLANVSQVQPELRVIPQVLLNIFPYVVTLIALVISSKSSQAPRASGEPFEKGKR